MKKDGKYICDQCGVECITIPEEELIANAKKMFGENCLDDYGGNIEDVPIRCGACMKDLIMRMLETKGNA